MEEKTDQVNLRFVVEETQFASRCYTINLDDGTVWDGLVGKERIGEAEIIPTRDGGVVFLYDGGVFS